eukprot:CAMPEP_0119316004 /NCGR_PEP_ID=MMETSP1333-20130426/38126_1 /TAXON_ID=418940 /ORGANISM="Scyphosphaera apsteinii, Strain RCC1455" /LENGTH=220 /DNA_ID=CAMNT_0007321535 /DNA_START=177 /DNA_END=839 /DNA_ORIENTATION=+
MTVVAMASMQRPTVNHSTGIQSLYCTYDAGAYYEILADALTPGLVDCLCARTNYFKHFPYQPEKPFGVGHVLCEKCSAEYVAAIEASVGVFAGQIPDDVRKSCNVIKRCPGIKVYNMDTSSLMTVCSKATCRAAFLETLASNTTARAYLDNSCSVLLNCPLQVLDAKFNLDERGPTCGSISIPQNCYNAARTSAYCNAACQRDLLKCTVESKSTRLLQLQ